MITRNKRTIASILATLMILACMPIVVVAGTGSYGGPVFVGYDSDDFSFSFDILEYEGGLATIAVTPKITGFVIENITILLNDATAPDHERIIDIRGGVFSIPTGASYAFASSHESDGIRTFYYCNIVVLKDYAGGVTTLTIEVTDSVEAYNDEEPGIVSFSTQYTWQEYNIVSGARGTLLGNVQDIDPNAYPVNGPQSDIWYVFVGSVVIPLVTINSPSQNDVFILGANGRYTLNVQAASTTPVFRMSVEIIHPDGSRTWPVNGEAVSSININVVLTQSGRYTLMVSSRSFVATDPRSGASTSTVNFDVRSSTPTPTPRPTATPTPRPTVTPTPTPRPTATPTPTPPPPIPIPTINAPSATSTTATVRWNGVSGATGYTVMIQGQLFNVGASARSFTREGLTPKPAVQL